MAPYARGEVDASARNFTVLMVPCNASKPLCDVSVSQPAGEAIGCLMAHCRAHFSQHSLGKDQEAAFRGMVEGHAKGASVPDDLFAQMAKTTTVDVIILVPNRADTEWISVNAYVDDKGVAKQLPVNARASSICAAVGLPQTVHGDCFIGRQFDDNEGFYRLDFGVADLNDDKWIARAKHSNMTARAAGNAGKLKDFISSQQTASASASASASAAAPPAPTPKDPALLAKEVGNKLFAAGKWDEAGKAYSKGLAALGLAEPGVPAPAAPAAATATALYSNRSACHAKLGDFGAALRDAEACLGVSPTWPKGLGRKAEALEGLGRLAEAKEAILAGRELAVAASAAGAIKEFDNMLALLEAKMAAPAS
jgi:hypothetical protein